MRGAEDPVAPASLRAAAWPPDPGDPRREAEGRTMAEGSEVVPRPVTLAQEDEQTSAGQERDDQDEDMPLSSPDSIVAETQTSQAAEEESEDRMENEDPLGAAHEERDNLETVQQEDKAVESDSKTENAGQQHQEEEQRDVQPAEMFAAVVAAMQAAPATRPREEWITTIAALYAVAHETVAIDEERVPAAKRRYPKLKGEERALLTRFFKEAFVVSKGTFADWTRSATAATRDLYNTSWSMKTILERMIGRVKWARDQPMNLWTAKVKAGMTDEVTPNGMVKQYQTYMFNPAKFSKEDISKLMKLCEQPAAAAHGRALREGSKDEWRILEAMATGNIVCRRTPAFVKSVLDSKEITRLNRTIQMQVEGELVLQLRGRGSVPASRRNTRAIKDDIMLAAVKAGVNLDEVQGMLNKTKTISFNAAQRSIHFFYFDRSTAKKYQSMYIPFQKQIHALVNVHGPETGSVWDRQLARDGTRPTATRDYAVVIHNVTRFTDVGRLTAYLEQHIPTEFELEDLDTCTPDSRTSTDWRLTMKSMECPDFLRGVVRIIWFGRPLIVQHPAVGYRFQCLRCGNIGHPMARCSYTDKQLAGPGSRVAVDSEVAKLEDLAKPFTSFAEMQVTAHKRLSRQATAARKADEAVRPDKPNGISQEEARPMQTSQAGENNHQRRSTESAARNFVPVPKKNRVTLLKRADARVQTDETIPIPGFSTQPSRYAELDDSDRAGEEQEEKTEDNPPDHETIELSSGDERDNGRRKKITAAEKARLHLVSDKPPKLTPTPQLVALKQRERTALAHAIQKLQQLRGQPVRTTGQALEKVTTAEELEDLLGLRAVATPASGNCMAMALAQAATDQDLVAPPGELERITAIIKRGVGWSGQINFLEQFDHFTRKMTLINVDRGWETMDAHESSKQFRWYLHDYATSSSDPEVFIPRHNWGSSELMALAASFMQRKIYVMAYDVDHLKQWQCCMYKPGSGSKGRRVYEKGVQVSLQLDRWMAELQKEKAGGTSMPLVVRYWGEHYSAYVHTQHRTYKAERDREQQDADMEVDEQYNAGSMQQSPNESASEEMQQGSSQEPWDPATWDGNIEELRHMLTGLTIPHELQREIHHILEEAEPTRYAELLAFLINTVAQLSQPQRDQLLAMDLRDESNEAIREVLQRYQIPLVTLKQWQQEVASQARVEQEQLQLQESDGASQPDSVYEPSQSSSVASSQQLSQVVTRSGTKEQLGGTQGAVDQPKRSHTMTLIEGEQIRQVMRSQTGPIAIAKQRPPSDRSSQQEVKPHPGREGWAAQWQRLRPIWPLTAKVPFPTASGSMTEWTEAAHQEPTWLLRTLQRFEFPDEVLMKLSVRVFEAWTAVWRTECLYGRLVAMRSMTKDPFIRQWLDSWKGKFERHPQATLPPLIDNSEDWQKMRANGYGGDDILTICDTNNRLRFAQHTICAFLYEKELKVLTGLENEIDNGAQTRLVRHMLALRTVPEYQRAYTNMPQTVNWRAVARFFQTVLEQGVTAEDQHAASLQ